MAEQGSPLQWVRYSDEQGETREAILARGVLHEPATDPKVRPWSLRRWLVASAGKVEEAIAQLEDRYGQDPADGVGRSGASLALWPAKGEAHWLPPIDQQEIWGAGVTYRRSREARREEAKDGGDVYQRVYAAKRPELFYKGNLRTVVGHGGRVGIRVDSSWDAPEPELAVLFNPRLEAVGFTIGLDMSSRSIEGENPLYLPQAKIYNASCALGPGLLLWAAEDWPQLRITMTIEREKREVFYGEAHTEQLSRCLPELAEYLGRSNDFPEGVFLLTGTGIVPPADFTLEDGDVIRTQITNIGTLVNAVKRV